MKLAIRLVLVSFLLISRTLSAAEVNGLFEAEVIVKSEHEKDGIKAIQQALKIVLTRVLAGKEIFQDETVKTVLENASYYVDEYQHSLIAIDNRNNDESRLMRVLFDEKLLIDVFRPSKLRFWNEIRPRTLVWLVVEEDGKESLFDSSVMPVVDAAFDKAARRKTLPVLYPIQDLKENRLLSVSDVLSAHSEHLLEVSSRYDVLSTLAGKIVKRERCWQAEWTYYFDNKIKQWQSECSSLDNATLVGVQGVYDTLSLYYAAKSELKEVNSVVLKVSNIYGMGALEKVTDYLEALPMIKTVTWVDINSGYNNFRLFYQGDREILNNSLVKNRVLRAEDYSVINENEVKYTLLLN